MANKIRARGMKLWYATEKTAWTPIAAGADPGGGWTQVEDLNSIAVVPFEVDEFDDSNLEDTVPDLNEIAKPGMVTVEMDKNDAAITLDGFAQARTKKAWAVTYVDGTARYCDSAVVIPTKGGDGQKGNFTDSPVEAFKIKALSRVESGTTYKGAFVLKAHA